MLPDPQSISLMTPVLLDALFTKYWIWVPSACFTFYLRDGVDLAFLFHSFSFWRIKLSQIEEFVLLKNIEWLLKEL